MLQINELAFIMIVNLNNSLNINVIEKKHKK